MKKLVLLASILLSTSSFANVSTVKANLAKNLPNVEIQNIQTTEMKGIYSGSLAGQIVYLNEDAQHMISGSMVRLDDQRNLTKDLLVKQNSIDWKTLPLNDAIKIVKGNGKRQLAVFTDPNCPYCKNLEAELKKLNDITIYIFAYAIKPQSIEPSKKVYCAKNPTQAWDDLMVKGIEPSGLATCDNPVERNLKLGRNLAITGTPTLIFSNGLKVSGAYPAEQIVKIFEEFGL